MTLPLLLLGATGVDAQPAVFSGLLTGQLGVAAQGDVRDATVMPSASMAVLDANGLGIELDVGYGSGFDDVQFPESSIATVMLNVVAAYPHERFRPFIVAGAGVLRVRVARPAESSTSLTDTGWSAGGGLLYMLNEAVGIRGEIRYFGHLGRHDDLPLGGNRRLDFVRTSFGVAFSWPMQY